MSLEAYFPGEIVIKLDQIPRLARILPPFRQALALGHDLAYSIQFLSDGEVLEHVSCEELASISTLVPRGMPFSDSKYDSLMRPLFCELYNNFDALKQSMFIPATTFPLGNYVQEYKNVRDYLAAGCCYVETLKNELSTLGDCENKGTNPMMESLAAPKEHKLAHFSILQVGNAIKIGSFLGLVRRIYAVQRTPFDNVFCEAELIICHEVDYMLTGITVQIPLIYDMQIFDVVAIIEAEDTVMRLPLLFLNQELTQESRDTIAIKGVFVPQQQHEVCQCMQRVLSNECQTTEQLDGIIMKFNALRVYARDNIPHFENQDDEETFEYYINRRDSGFYVAKRADTSLYCYICSKAIQKTFRGCDRRYEDPMLSVAELNRINGMLTCPSCEKYCHPSCYYSRLPAHLIQLSELLSNGYSYTGINTHCDCCIGKQPNYYANTSENFWQTVLLNNYNGQPELNASEEVLRSFEYNLQDYQNCLRNWHILQINEQFEVQPADALVSRLERFMFTYVTKVDKGVEITFGRTATVYSPSPVGVAQNAHYTQNYLVTLFSCLESYMSVSSNMLYWLEIWYTDQDFEDFRMLDVQHIRGVLLAKYGTSAIEPESEAKSLKEPVQKSKLRDADEKETRRSAEVPDRRSRKNEEVTREATEPTEKTDQATSSQTISVTPQIASQTEQAVEPAQKPEIERREKNPSQSAVPTAPPRKATQEDQTRAKNAEMQRVYEDLKQRHEQALLEPIPPKFGEQIRRPTGETVLLHQPFYEREERLSMPEDLPADFEYLKTGVQQTLDMLQNPADTELQSVIQSVMQDRPPAYENLGTPGQPERFVSLTEQLLHEFRQGIFDPQSILHTIKFLQSTLPQLESAMETGGNIECMQMTHFPASKTLKREVCKREILEMDQRSEELQAQEQKLKSENEEDITEIECIRTAMSELKQRLIFLATELDEREGVSKRLEIELRSIIESEALLSERYCEERNEDPELVASDVLVLRQARDALLSKIKADLAEE